MANASNSFDLTRGFAGSVLGPVSLEAATRRVLAYCTNPDSAWGVYDLAANAAREADLFDTVTPWSLLLANALNGRVALKDVASFDLEKRSEFARRVRAVEPNRDLAAMDGAEREAVAAVCAFGYSGVWGPKITKVGALFRPHAVPVLDGHVAMAFGYDREGFSVRATQRGLDRWGRIRLVIDALGHGLDDHREVIGELREHVEPTVPEVRQLPDLRLLDIVIWTSQDDRMSRTGKGLDWWLHREPGAHIPQADFEPVSVPS